MLQRCTKNYLFPVDRTGRDNQQKTMNLVLSIANLKDIVKDSTVDICYSIKDISNKGLFYKVFLI